MLATDPKWTEANSALATRLQSLDRPEEALLQINRTLADAAQLSILERRHYDFDAQYDHALVIKSYLLFELGRHDEALGIASAMGIGGRVYGPNPQTPLLISQWLIALGRGAEALETLAPIKGKTLSLDGLSDLSVYRICAAAQAKSKFVLLDNIRFLREHTIYKPGALVEALRCANDINAAADAVVAALDDSRQRALMLGGLQFYKPAKIRTAAQVLMEKRLDQARSCPKVVDAVNRVGRINHYEIRFLGSLY
jgi:hypothetical protein